MSLEFDEKNKKLARDLKKILTELKRITKGNLEIIDMYDNEIIIDAELSDNQFEKLKDWLRSNRYIDVNGAQNWITHYIDYDEYYITEEYRKIDNDWNYTDNSLVLEYYRVKSNDKEYYILKKIYFEGRK